MTDYKDTDTHNNEDNKNKRDSNTLKRKDALKRQIEEHEANVEMENIKEFDFKGIPENPVFLIVAKRGSGKTFLLKYIVKFLNDEYKYNEVYLFSKTAHLQTKLEEDPFFFIPKNNIHYEFDEQAINNIMSHNESLKIADNKQREDMRRNNKILIIFDDMINDKNITRSNTLAEICTRGRHSNISLCLISQDLSSRNAFGTTVRKNIDCFVSFDIYDKATRDMAADAFLSKFNPNVGKILLTKIPMLEPYMATFILFRNKDTSFQPQRYSDYVFKYKAPDKKMKEFVIGRDPKKDKKKSIESKDKVKYPGIPFRGALKVTDEYTRRI